MRGAYGLLGSSVGIGINLLLAIVKFLLGFFSGSLAITADAVNNLSDAFGSILSLFSVRLAQKPVDREHPFGHGRMEYIGSLAMGALIVFLGLRLLQSGIQGIITPAALSFSLMTALLLVLSVLVKLWLFFFYRKLGRMIDSAPLLAASKDSLSDVAATSAVLLSLGVQAGLGWLADGYIGVLVALFVLKAGIDVCKDTINLLLGQKPDGEKIRQIREAVLSYEGIVGVHDLILHDYGAGRCLATVHAEVSAKGDIVAVHEIIDRAEQEIGEELNLVLSIHMDPIVTDDENTNAVRSKLENTLQEIDPRLSMHDFRMVPGEKKINLIFDCVLPCGYTGQEELQQSLTTYVKSLDSRYELIVRFDIDYV